MMMVINHETSGISHGDITTRGGRMVVDLHRGNPNVYYIFDPIPINYETIGLMSSKCSCNG